MKILSALFRSVWHLVKVCCLIILLFALFSSVSYYTIKHVIRGEEVAVPNLVGLTPNEGLEALKPFKLSLKLDKKEFSRLEDAGKIISQFPYPDTKAKAGATVRVVVSEGLVLVKTPSVTGQDLSAAKVAIRRTDLEIGNISRVHHETIGKGRVLAVDPPSNAWAERGSKVNILVSLGKRKRMVAMPLLKNMTRREAERLLFRYNLKIAEVKEVRAEVPENDLIVDQTPPAGAPIDGRTHITVFVSSNIGS